MDYIDAPNTYAAVPTKSMLARDTLSMKAERLLENYRNLPKTSLALAGLAGVGILAILGGLWMGKSRLFSHHVSEAED